MKQAGLFRKNRTTKNSWLKRGQTNMDWIVLRSDTFDDIDILACHSLTRHTVQPHRNYHTCTDFFFTLAYDRTECFFLLLQPINTFDITAKPLLHFYRLTPLFTLKASTSLAVTFPIRGETFFSMRTHTLHKYTNLHAYT